MSKGQAIKDNNLNEWNCFLGAIKLDDLAEMLASVGCEKCICKSFCKTYVDATCQETIRCWLELDINES